MLAAWTFVVIFAATPPYVSAWYSPSYPTREVCEAARRGVIEAGGPIPEWCTNDPFVAEGQWLDKIKQEKFEEEAGGPY